MKHEKKMVCRQCGKIFPLQRTMDWVHPRIEGEKISGVCPDCNRKRIEYDERTGNINPR